MATLTGFKVVGDSSTASGSNQQQATNGHQNPVFVFEEVDVGDANDSLKGNSDENDIFVDANSVDMTDNNANANNNKNNVSNSLPTTDSGNSKQQDEANHKQDQTSSKPDHAQAINVNSDKQQQQPNTATTNNSSESTVMRQQQKSVTPPPSLQTKQVPAVAIDMPANMPVSAPSTPMGTRKNKGSSSSKNHQHSLSPNANDPSAETMSVSMLSIGTGKSPRTPRRSPLMALFRGKPRESVRKMYTDEDQFEIEWANVCLEVQQKWYQKYSLSSLSANLCGSSGDSTISDKPQRNKLILNTVNGRIRSGEITAILGPSGKCL